MHQADIGHDADVFSSEVKTYYKFLSLDDPNTSKTAEKV